jgi:mono/diheme cytochrome c family protein
MTGRLAFVLGGWALLGCRTDQTLVTPDPHLNRMLEQPKLLPYGRAPQMPQGMAMQQPPEGTMPVGAIAGQPLLSTGIADGRYGARFPVRVDRSMVEAGHARFDTFCAPCHGMLGDGVSVVAEKMSLRKPPDLTKGRFRELPAGEVFATIRQGYGLMPSYSVQLSVDEAWGVAAYVRALQIARGTPVAELSPGERRALEQEAP